MPDPTACATCGASLQDQATFCGTCGTPTAGAPAEPPPPNPAPPPTEPIPPIVPPPPNPAPPPTEPIPSAEPLPPLPPTVAEVPVAAPRPTLADQAVAGAGGAGAAPPAGPGTGEERPHWMPDPAKESTSSRTGLFIVLGVAAGVLLTLVALVVVLLFGRSGGGGDDVSSQDTTTTTAAEPTTTSEATTTTEAPSSTTTSEATTTTASSGSSTQLSQLAVGDCVTNDLVSGQQALDEFGVVDCDEPHRAEVISSVRLPDGPFPTSTQLSAEVTTRCQGDVFEAYVGRAYATSQVYVTGVTPGQAGWEAGDHQLVCFGHERDGGETTGSIEGSGR